MCFIKSVLPLYFNPTSPFALEAFGECLKGMIYSKIKPSEELIIVCIGTDRVTGDCLGPLAGYLLKKSNAFSALMPIIYGDLIRPVHAGNLRSFVSLLKEAHPHSFIIALDASVGSVCSIGYITLSFGSLQPGAGVSKNLPKIGDISITGIVCPASENGFSSLSNTRLNTVMTMAEYIKEGIILAFSH